LVGDTYSPDPFMRHAPPLANGEQVNITSEEKKPLRPPELSHCADGAEASEMDIVGDFKSPNGNLRRPLSLGNARAEKAGRPSRGATSPYAGC
jgi:hypothetical protein